MAIIDYKKSIIHITLLIAEIDSVSHTTISTKYEFDATLFSAVMKFQKLWMLIPQDYSIMALEFFFHYILHLASDGLA